MKGFFLQTTVITLGVWLILGSGSNDSPSNDISSPSNISATPAYEAAVITWDEVASADSYQVCSATENIVSFENCLSYAGGKLVTVTSNSTVITSLTAGQPYYFNVAAKAGNASASSTSNMVIATPNLGLNDTGIMLCGSGAANNLACPILGYAKQDAQNGLDAESTNNIDGDGGFNFTKLDSAGEALDANANDWACVKDNITGLIWEAKTSANANDLFKWYSTDSTSNAGTSGFDASGESICTGYDGAEPRSYCNTQAYADRVNAGSHCGITNWRLPTRHELISIVNYNVVEPTADLAYFNYTSTALYWSGTSSFSSATASDRAWASSFTYGGSAKQLKQDSLRVRLVSSGQ